MASPEKLAALRHLLAERFPSTARMAPRVLPTGIAPIDVAMGGLPIGAITEVVCASPTAGGHLLLAQLLARTRISLTRVALIDSADSFDPDSFTEDLLAHLLWVRCRTTAEAMQAVDFTARDANFGLVVLDVRHAPEADLRRIPATQWYRLQRAVEPTDLALVVETARVTVPSAQVRLAFQTPYRMRDLWRDRQSLISRLEPAVQRQRIQAAAG